MTTIDAPPLREDVAIWPALASLTSCLCQEIVASGLPEVYICTPLPGEQIAAEYVSEDAGMAWTRLVSAFPSTTFPAQALVGCFAPLAFEVELGVLYCAPEPGADGSPPDMAAQFDATRLQVAAMAAMRRALLCCFPTGNSKDLILGPYAPIGPDGGVVGGTWTVWVAEGAI